MVDAYRKAVSKSLQRFANGAVSVFSLGWWLTSEHMRVPIRQQNCLFRLGRG